MYAAAALPDHMAWEQQPEASQPRLPERPLPCCHLHVPNPASAPMPCTHADGYYQVIVVAYNQYGFKRSEASNIVTVGAPSIDSQPLAVWAGDGDGKISIRFPTPVVRVPCAVYPAGQPA